MCRTCGCGDGEGEIRYTALGGSEAGPAPVGGRHPHDGQHSHDGHHIDDVPHVDDRRRPHEAHHSPGEDHPHGDDHPHEEHGHRPGAAATRTLLVEERVLARNDQLAAANRSRLTARDVLVVNLMGSPGSGKTTLLERTLRERRDDRPMAVVEGDQETVLDAERIRAAGCPVIQINTGQGCHLDATMLERALRELDPVPGSLVFVENVGNLVCPALFDLGEGARVVLMSVTEGEDKPAKYSHMFATADLVVLNKSDLLPYLDFDVSRCLDQVRRINPTAEMLVVSATRGQGLARWYGWLRRGGRDRAGATPVGV